MCSGTDGVQHRDDITLSYNHLKIIRYRPKTPIYQSSSLSFALSIPICLLSLSIYLSLSFSLIPERARFSVSFFVWPVSKTMLQYYLSLQSWSHCKHTRIYPAYPSTCKCDLLSKNVATTCICTIAIEIDLGSISSKLASRLQRNNISTLYQTTYITYEWIFASTTKLTGLCPSVTHPKCIWFLFLFAETCLVDAVVADIKPDGCDTYHPVLLRKSRACRTVCHWRARHASLCIVVFSCWRNSSSVSKLSYICACDQLQNDHTSKYIIIIERLLHPNYKTLFSFSFSVRRIRPVSLKIHTCKALQLSVVLWPTL